MVDEWIVPFHSFELFGYSKEWNENGGGDRRQETEEGKRVTGRRERHMKFVFLNFYAVEMNKLIPFYGPTKQQIAFGMKWVIAFTPKMIPFMPTKHNKMLFLILDGAYSFNIGNILLTLATAKRKNLLIRATTRKGKALRYVNFYVKRILCAPMIYQKRRKKDSCHARQYVC